MGNTDKFDLMANIYDNDERVKLAEISSKAIKSFLNNTKNKSAMDFGCGTGLVGISLIDDFDSVLFVDSSTNMINVVDEKLKSYKIINGKTIWIDIENEKFLNAKVDCIFMAQVLLHIKDTRDVLCKLYKSLKSGGKLYITDFDKNYNINSDVVHNGFEQEALKKMLQEIGFQKVSSKTFYEGENIFMKEDATMFVLEAIK